MATCCLALGLLMALVVSAYTLDESQKQEAILVAMEEMQHANYFTFVTLINIMKDRIPMNATFLMPNDRSLAKVMVREGKVLELLLRHSIPSLLLYDEMKHFPSGTMLPTYQSGYMLKITNNGRNNFTLNNARLVSINICTAGSWFRCHGIEGILETAKASSGAPTLPSCVVNSSAPISGGSSVPILPAPLESPLGKSPGAAPVHSRVGSSSSDLLHSRSKLHSSFVLCMLVSMTMLLMW